jgi:hypothetical protein
MTRKIAALLLASSFLLALLAPTAAADRRQQTIFDATNDLLLADSVAARDRILNRLRLLGTDTLRIVVPWRSIVPGADRPQMPEGFDPTDPADYEGGVIDSIDRSIRGAVARGMRVLLTPSAPVPDWASASGHSSLANPEPAAFEQLLVGLGKRYDGTFGCFVPSVCYSGTPPILSGDNPIDLSQLGIPVDPLPRVEFWSVWNEPNLDLFLRPQSRRGKPYAGSLYRSLFLAAREGLRESGHGDDQVLIGETSPSSGYTSTDPIAFLRQVFCLNSGYRRVGSCQPIAAAGWAQHPYDPRGTPMRVSSGRVLGVPALGRLTRALARAARAGATTGRLPVYVTEYGVESVPDRDGVSLIRQAEYLAITEFLLWRNPAVRSYAQYLLFDDRPQNEFAFQSGLLTHGGAVKPSYDAFPIPLVVERRGRRLRLWGHVRPGDGARRVEVQVRRPGARARSAGVATTDSEGYFTLGATYAPGKRWRAVCRLPGGRVLRGPWERAYAFR